MSEQLALLPEYLTAHIQLTLLALLFSTAISLPLGIYVTRSPWLEPVALGIAGVIQTVPSLALLALMVPLLASVDLQSIGFLPAIVGLTLYGIFPILRNTVTGIAGVNLALKEAAQAVGMTPAQQLTRVELPLAMPMIVAGIRTSTVWVVGIATLSTPVGATSLGNYIFSGLQTRNYAALMIGCFAAAVLALVLDGLVRAIERGVQTHQRRPVWAALGIVLVLYGYAAITLATPLFGGRDRPVVIGAKTFTEQYILSEILSEWIEQHTDRSTTLVQSLGSMVAFDALAVGDVDVYVDYSGTLWANEMGQGNVTASRTEVLGKVERFLREERGLTLAATLGFENSYALAVRAADADRLGLSQISDLDRYAPKFAMAGDYEFFARPEWRAIRDTYDLAFRELVTMDSTLMYQAAALGQVDVISAFSSDGRVTAYNLTVLEDDRAAIPPYDAVVLASERLARDEPAVIKALTRLDGTISEEQMRTMNLAVNEQGQDPRVVARRFVAELVATGPPASR